LQIVYKGPQIITYCHYIYGYPHFTGALSLRRSFYFIRFLNICQID